MKIAPDGVLFLMKKRSKKMKKKVVAAIAAVMITGTSMQVNACTPSYKPVSSQPWYKSYQGALNSAYKAGQNIKINAKIDPKYFENIKIN